MPLCTKTLEVTAATPDATRKMDRAVQTLTGLSRRQIVGLFEQHCVVLNRTPCDQPWRRLSVGDVVEVRYDPQRRYQPSQPPRRPGFGIVFEDAHLIVVDKPAGWLTVPTPRREAQTLIQRVSDYLSRGQRCRVRVQTVQRLDRGVSGVLVFAKTNDAAAALRDQFERHAPERLYVGIVAGQLAPDAGTFRSYLATSKSLQRYSTTREDRGELAVTHYQVERRWPDATLVRVWLETGRRHQIRVHFAEAGHPVLGDKRYDDERARHPRWPARRLALHAAVLALQHPATGAACHFEAALPSEFQTFFGAWQWPGVHANRVQHELIERVLADDAKI